MSKKSRQTHSVHAARFEGVLTERYHFAGHLPVVLPPHSHDEYQVGLALTDVGEYRYRRNRYTVPIGSVSVIHPGEIHGVCGLGIRDHTSVFIQFYLPVALVRQTCEEANVLLAADFVFLQQSQGRHDLTGCAVSALKSIVAYER